MIPLLFGLVLLVIAVMVFDRSEWLALALFFVVAALILWGLGQ